MIERKSENSPLFASRPTVPRGWPKGLGWVLTICAGYATSYFLVRVRDKDASGNAEIHCTSRISQLLFAPLIKLEQSFRGSWRGLGLKDEENRSFEEILRLAKDSHRKVLLTVGTKSCLPCRQLERFLKEHESLLSRYFLVAKVNVDDGRGPGEAIHRRYRQEKGTSAKFHYFPWMAFVDGDGNTIVTGDDGPPGTIGIPQGGQADREWFLKMLKIAFPEIAEEELVELDSAALRFHQKIWEGSHTKG